MPCLLVSDKSVLCLVSIAGRVGAVPGSGPAAAAARVTDADVLGASALQQLCYQPGAHGAFCL